MSVQQAADLRERLAESESLIAQLTTSWEERLQETERVHSERHLALKRMGIQVAQAGIKVECGRFYLMNLNADPAMNELLVYHLKECTRVGNANDCDVLLSGLGVMALHCTLSIESNKLYAEPAQDARYSTLQCIRVHSYYRVCVNGRGITGKVPLRHGYRLLIGNDHFFRVNCPKDDTGSSYRTPCV